MRNIEAGDYDNAEQSAEHYAKLYPDAPETAYAALSRGDVLL